MSSPASVEHVLARITQIQRRMALVAGADLQAGSPADVRAAAPSGGLSLIASPFASVLADAASGADATASTGPKASASWEIPWAAGLAPERAVASGVASVPLASGPSAGRTVSWPVSGTITQGFGPTSFALEPSAVVDGKAYAHYHDGLDIGAAEGSRVTAMAAGTVEFAGRYPDGAVVVRVRHADGSVALYAHLESELAVAAGDTVAAGAALGRVGMTGRTTGPHLHLELTVDGRNVDPEKVLRAGRLPGEPPAATTWTPASPLAAADGSLTDASLARFDALAGRIPYHAEIRDAAVRARLDPLLLASLVKAESGFHASSVSSAGAEGLLQLMPATARSLGVTDPFDPVQNLRAGARYFANNLRIYGRTDLALAAYHDGKGAVAAAHGVPDYPITHRYIDRICSYWTNYREAAA